ncbi:hypothetical protein L227DRAFT_612748 [Lentinus tigrinus ALCF2SS1-6]|uniref:Uncharacterized protein n=1 Tax=Lentinus tigrinus ALCF2SS1-6 TaxID=1328759 RepID=A0A5C2S4V1_9APHY|nr:hypothetical protein L227DRAFT_612748 [Lentinus tigrinus ALCF2SS1-6]
MPMPVDFHLDPESPWGPLLRDVWFCEHCGDLLKIMECRDPSKPNFGRKYVKCHPKDAEGKELHGFFFRFCQERRSKLYLRSKATLISSDSNLSTSSATSQATSSVSTSVSTLPGPPHATSASSSQELLSSSAPSRCVFGPCTYKHSKLCPHMMCSSHCPLIGGCELHTPISDRLFSMLVEARCETESLAARLAVIRDAMPAATPSVPAHPHPAAQSSRLQIPSGAHPEGCRSPSHSPWQEFVAEFETEAIPDIIKRKRSMAAFSEPETGLSTSKKARLGDLGSSDWACLQPGHVACERCSCVSDSELDAEIAEIKAAWQRTRDRLDHMLARPPLSLSSSPLLRPCDLLPSPASSSSQSFSESVPSLTTSSASSTSDLLSGDNYDIKNLDLPSQTRKPRVEITRIDIDLTADDDEDDLMAPQA